MHERLLGYRETETLLGRYSIHLAAARLVSSGAEAMQAAEAIGFPVALKMISPEQTHKSDSGLVILNLDNLQAVAAAAERLLEKAGGKSVEGLLVQRMAPGGVEILAGISQDAQFGPVVTFGAGGTLVELVEDISVRLAPISAWDAGRMLAETRVWRLLQGYRQHPPADVKKLVELLVTLAQLAMEQRMILVSMDLNPVFVLPAGQGLCVVDARAVIREEA
jgi:acyl-CoA synthetase (NDP forming)